jgi:hypothetical protein
MRYGIPTNFPRSRKFGKSLMTYTYSFDRVKSTLDPADFIQDQNNEFEENQEMNNEFDFDLGELGKFDPYEIL